MTILVIGGTGFVGLPVVQRLAAAGHRVTVIHRGQTTPELPASVSSIHGSRDERPTLRRVLDDVTPDVVLDMIAYTEAQAEMVADLSGQRADRLIVLSSGDVYRQYDGLRGQSTASPDPVPLTEEAPLRTSRYPYRGADTDFAYAHDYDKILVEQQIRACPIPSTILRLPKVYGPRDGAHHVGEALSRIRASEGSVVLGKQHAEWRWSRGYVENVAAAIATAVTHDTTANKTYNLGEPSALPEAKWLRRVAYAAGLELSINTRPDDEVDGAPPFDWTYDMALDTHRLRTELDFAEPVGRAEALSRSVAWEREHGQEKRNAK